jgi:thiamine-phosphate pyrophosphorylase
MFYVPNIFYFAEDIDETISKNIKKFKNIAIVYQNPILDIQKFLYIKNFCKKHSIKLYIIDNFKLSIKYKLNGIVISHSNKRNILQNNFTCKRINFLMMGKAHNQIDYSFKEKQFCHKIFLSPLFSTKKYKGSKILNIHKFNLISMNWKKNLYALGGINYKNYKKIKLTKSLGFGFSGFINEPQIKKPTYF